MSRLRNIASGGPISPDLYCRVTGSTSMRTAVVVTGDELDVVEPVLFDAVPATDRHRAPCLAVLVHYAPGGGQLTEAPVVGEVDSLVEIVTGRLNSYSTHAGWPAPAACGSTGWTRRRTSADSRRRRPPRCRRSDRCSRSTSSRSRPRTARPRSDRAARWARRARGSASRGSQTSISPIPRFAHARYGIATSWCGCARSCPSLARAIAWTLPVTTSTPPSSSPRNSLSELRVVGHDDVERVAAVVRPLGRVDDWPALERHAARVVLHARIGDDAPDRHRQVDLDLVARAPLTIDAREAVGRARSTALPLTVIVTGWRRDR